MLINPARNPSIFRRRFPIRLWYPSQHLLRQNPLPRSQFGSRRRFPRAASQRQTVVRLGCILQHLEGLVDIVVTDENLHGRSSSIERLMGPMAKAPGPLAHGYAQFGCRWHPRYEPTSTFEIVPADGHHGCQLEETETSVRRRFLGSSSDKSLLASINGRAGDKEQ